MTPKRTDRISLDLDDTTEDVAINKAANMMEIDGVIRIEISQSASKKGFHVAGYLENPISFEEHIKYREELGDDKKRIKYSKENVNLGLALYDVLFTAKVRKDGTITKAKKLYDIIKNKNGSWTITPL